MPAISDLSLRLLVLVLSLGLGALLVLPLPPLLKAMGLERTNFRGEPIGSGAGLLFVVGALPWLFAADPASRLCAVAVVGFGLLGLIDDRWGTAEFKGLRGHLGALRRGRITTGMLKAAGGGVLALTLSFWVPAPSTPVTAAPLIALSANAFNLLDLRPLRALKIFWLLGLIPTLAGPLLLTQTWSLTLPYARREARAELMLGDTGSNALGALLGVVGALMLPPALQAGVVAALVLFHVWAEKHSLTLWIEAHPWARTLDQWGRRNSEVPPFNAGKGSSATLSRDHTRSVLVKRDHPGRDT